MTPDEKVRLKNRTCRMWFFRATPLSVRADDCSEDGTSAEDAKLALSEVFFLWFTFDGRCRVMACDMGGVEIDEVTGRGASFTSSTSMHSWRSG